MDQAIVWLFLFLCSIDSVFGIKCYNCSESETTRITADGKEEITDPISESVLLCSDMTILSPCPTAGRDICVQKVWTLEFLDKTVAGAKFQTKLKKRGCDTLSTAKPIHAKGGLNIESGKCKSPPDYAKYTKNIDLSTQMNEDAMKYMARMWGGDDQSVKVTGLSYCYCEGDLCNQNDTMPAAPEKPSTPQPSSTKPSSPKPSSAVIQTVDIQLNIITTGITVAVLLLLRY